MELEKILLPSACALFAMICALGVAALMGRQIKLDSVEIDVTVVIGMVLAIIVLSL